MSKLFANIGLLSQSIAIVNNLKNAHDPDVLNTVKINNDSIKVVGLGHDDCLSSVSTSGISSFLNNVSADLGSLSSSIDYAMTSSLDYSNSKIDTLIFNGVNYTITEGDVKEGLIIPQSFFDPNIPLSDKISKSSFIDMYKNGELNSSTYNIEKYNKMLSDVIGNSTSQRERATNIAIFMSTVYPRLPYLLGGGHFETDDVYGIDSKWATIIPENSKSKYAVDNDERNNVVKWKSSDEGGPDRLYSLDCSGYVSWTLKNAGVDSSKSNYSYADFHYYNSFNNEKLSDPGVCDKIKPGDLVQEPGHIGIVVDKNKDYLVVSHVTGNTGTNLTKIDYNGYVLDDAMGKLYHDVTDPADNRVFDSVIYVAYDDEKENNKE